MNSTPKNKRETDILNDFFQNGIATAKWHKVKGGTVKLTMVNTLPGESGEQTSWGMGDSTGLAKRNAANGFLQTELGKRMLQVLSARQSKYKLAPTSPRKEVVKQMYNVTERTAEELLNERSDLSNEGQKHLKGRSVQLINHFGKMLALLDEDKRENQREKEKKVTWGGVEIINGNDEREEGEIEWEQNLDDELAASSSSTWTHPRPQTPYNRRRWEADN